MALEDKLRTEGSNYSKYNGGPGFKNPLGTRESLMHGDDTNFGYSPGENIVNDDRRLKTIVNSQYQKYDVGQSYGNPNTLPTPSGLDSAGGYKAQYPQYGHTQKHDFREGFKYDNLGPVDGRY